MKRKQVSGKTHRHCFGTFAPMHVGRVDLNTKAKRANDNARHRSGNTQKIGDAQAYHSTAVSVMFEKFSSDELVNYG